MIPEHLRNHDNGREAGTRKFHEEHFFSKYLKFLCKSFMLTSILSKVTGDA